MTRTPISMMMRYGMRNSSFSEMLAKDLAVMDLTAATMCKDNHIPVMVFSLEDPRQYCPCGLTAKIWVQ